MDKKSKMQEEKVTTARWYFYTRISVGAQHRARVFIACQDQNQHKKIPSLK